MFRYHRPELFERAIRMNTKAETANTEAASCSEDSSHLARGLALLAHHVFTLAPNRADKRKKRRARNKFKN